MLVDKATFPRDKCCGDGLTASALRLLEDLGLDPADVPSWTRIDDVTVTGPTQRSVTLPMPRERGTFAAVARRADLDLAVLDLARAHGVDVRQGHAFQSATQHRDRVDVMVDGSGVVEAPFVVGADGMWSPLRRSLGDVLVGYRGDWHAFRQYYRNVSPRAAQMLQIWFEPELLPAYAWSFPAGHGTVNLGFGIIRGEKVAVSDMGALWERLLARPHIAAFLGPDAQAEAPHRAWPIPTRLPGPKLTNGRVLYVGDAAALADPMTGEGIGQALASGMSAARSILATGPHDPASVATHYESWVSTDLLPDNKMAGWLTHALRHRKGTRAAIAIADVSPWTRRCFARWLFEDEPRAALLTPRRLHRSFLRRDGAYLEADLTKS